MHKCAIDDCNYESKDLGHIKRHKANIHDIGIIWNKCDISNCEYKCKDKNRMKQHKANIHDIFRNIS